MSDIMTAKCEKCGSIFSANFGVYRSTGENLDKNIKEEYGEKIYSQYMEMLEKLEKEINFNVEDYDCFEIERVHDLDYKRKMLTLRKKYNEDSLVRLEEFISKFEKSDESVSEEGAKFFKDLFNKSKFSLKEINEALKSGTSKLINEVYNNRIGRNTEIFENRLFICPECGKMDNKFYLGIFSSDYEYALKTKCTECNVMMISYDSFERAIEENAFCCTKCGSNELTIEHALHLD